MGYRAPRVTRTALGPIQDYCIEKNLPRLTSIVVNKRTGLPGSGFILDSGTIVDSQKRAFSYDWSQERIPFPPNTILTGGAKSSGEGTRGTVKYEVPDMEAIINGRGPYQALFKKTLPIFYGHRCAVCDTRHSAFLIGAHIVPWAEDSLNRMNPRNGILLCRTHDAVFELGWMRVKPDRSVSIVLPEGTEPGKDLRRLLKVTERTLRCSKPTFAPSAAFLEWRAKKIK